jgi:hypothetical protein
MGIKRKFEDLPNSNNSSSQTGFHYPVIVSSAHLYE